MKSVALVLLNYNGLELLKKLLPTAIENSKQAKLVLIDNGSTDESVDWVSKNHPEVDCIELNSNLGYAGGYNEGLKNVKADYYALVNTDIELTADWLSPLLQHLELHLNTVAVQPHILDHSKRTHFEYAGAAGGYIDALGIPFCRGRIFNRCEEDKEIGMSKTPTMRCRETTTTRATTRGGRDDESSDGESSDDRRRSRVRRSAADAFTTGRGRRLERNARQV